MTKDADLRALSNMGEDQLLRTWYDGELRQSMGTGLDDTVGVAGDLRTVFEAWLSRNLLTSVICDQWDYCERVASSDDELALALGLSELVAQALGGDPSVAAAAAVLVVKHGFDSLCDCPD